MKRTLSVFVFVMLLASIVPNLAFAADCRTPRYGYCDMYFTGTRHHVDSKFTGITVHSKKTVMNNSITCRSYAQKADRVTNKKSWVSTSASNTDASTSSTAYCYVAPATQYVVGGRADVSVKCLASLRRSAHTQLEAAARRRKRILFHPVHGKR